MFERKHEKLAPFPVFLGRVARYLAAAAVLAAVALLMGTAGYHWIAGLNWVDALLNASMILGGMGPVDRLSTTGAKLFASAYALVSGLVFIAIMGIVLSPIVHRVLHKFHIDKTK
jgi:hypothetical protein